MIGGNAIPAFYGDFFRKAVDQGELPLFYRVGEKGMVSYVEGLKTGEN